MGASTPNRVNVVMGRYDSRVTDIMNFTDDAPGAGDNTSGVAVVLEPSSSRPSGAKSRAHSDRRSSRGF